MFECLFAYRGCLIRISQNPQGQCQEGETCRLWISNVMHWQRPVLLSIVGFKKRIQLCSGCLELAHFKQGDTQSAVCDQSRQSVTSASGQRLASLCIIKSFGNVATGDAIDVLSEKARQQALRIAQFFTQGYGAITCSSNGWTAVAVASSQRRAQGK